MRNVLITGHNGYIGPHLVEILKDVPGLKVYGCDVNLFREDAWRELPIPDVEFDMDFRNLSEDQLFEIDTVIHLAAISNDPMGDLDENITLNINAHGTVAFAETCKRAGVNRFLMSSSCSIYGKSEKEDMVETDPTEPLTTYAKSKIYVEQKVGALASDEFCASFLRNATAYGYSPNLRIDLVVNNFLACAIARNQIQIMSDGSPWRPLIHCRDIANAFKAFLEAPVALINTGVFNIGANDQNFQVKDVADIANELFPSCNIVYTGEAVNDSRDYKVCFNKFRDAFPTFEFEYDLRKGMADLAEALEQHGFNEGDFSGDQFVRLRALESKIGLIS